MKKLNVRPVTKAFMKVVICTVIFCILMIAISVTFSILFDKYSTTQIGEDAIPYQSPPPWWIASLIATIVSMIVIGLATAWWLDETSY